MFRKIPPPSPLTEAQLKWMSERTEEVITAAVRKVRNEALVGFIIMLIGAIVGVTFGLHALAKANDTIVATGRIVSVDGCNRDYRTAQHFRSLFVRLEDASKQSYKEGRITKERLDQAIAFYERERLKILVPDCRKAATVITNNPADQTDRVPTPLHE